MAETLNMMSVSIDKFIQELKFDLEDGNYEPMMGIGLSGIGKTMSIYELTQELGIGFCELRLVTLTETDMLGIPKENEHGRTTYASNDLLPNIERDGEEGILVLDEITSASRTVRAAAYQLLDSKRALGNYKLPPKWKIVGLGNGPDDGGVYSGMEGAVLSRCTCYRIEPDLNSWKKWAVKHEVNSSVIAFLSFMPEMLHVFDPDEIASVFPCPRSWTALATRLTSREKRANKMLDMDSVEIYAAGSIGAKDAAKFSAFYAYNGKTINVDDIIEGRETNFSVRSVEPQVMYIMTQQLVKGIDKVCKESKKTGNDFPMETVNKIINVCKWIVNISKERLDLAVLTMQDLSKYAPDFHYIILNDERFDETYPEFVDWFVEQGLDNAV